MIAFVRVASVKPGKQVAAMAFAKEIAGFLKSSHHLDVEVLRPVGGNPQRIAWSTRYADMAAMEALSAKMTSDPKYWELVNGAADCFIAGSMHDGIWQTL
ncbi:hypothetical protein [Simplicispira suum]|uniref:ABM domain-containing protein n=1 Tax=Simplicispira suum TaxID=2109915 RepID=A0A2S0N3Y9_9BURK|nr:hypothetical protein [Simplicispira suum]AVO42860.1 hypothetical protein C6571_17555 [Simplicispira suum]MBW7834553.1 hypothetical protein [Simplicispira suum]